MKNYQALAWWQYQVARATDPDARNRWQDKIDAIMATAPSGSGFDSGTTLQSADEKRLVFATAYHHMNEHGFYDGWTHHRVTATADLMHGFVLAIKGRNKREIRDYIEDTFGNWLDENEPEPKA
jgi:hypothetical protein